MSRSRQRVQQFSSQKYRKTKFSQPTISTKKTITEKIRTHKFDSDFCEEMNKLKTLLPKTPPSLTSSSWCLYDSSRDQYIGFRDIYQREVASLTKIMTTILSINLLEKYQLDKQIAIRTSRNSASLNGTSAQLKYGKWVRLQDLLYGAMLPSGNDAAYLLSEVFGLLLFYQRMKPEDKEYEDIESIDITLYENTQPFVNRFLKEMNKMAKDLKLNKTSFANPHGLANSLNVSSARDMIELSKYACKNEYFRKIMNTQEYEVQFYEPDLQAIHEVKIWKNTNKLLVKGWDGVKTGQTQAAGACLASHKDGVFIVILNCNTTELRFSETQILYEWYKKSQQDVQ